MWSCWATIDTKLLEWQAERRRKKERPLRFKASKRVLQGKGDWLIQEPFGFYESEIWKLSSLLLFSLYWVVGFSYCMWTVQDKSIGVVQDSKDSRQGPRLAPSLHWSHITGWLATGAFFSTCTSVLMCMLWVHVKEATSLLCDNIFEWYVECQMGLTFHIPMSNPSDIDVVLL
jgi:hypothetical protein